MAGASEARSSAKTRAVAGGGAASKGNQMKRFEIYDRPLCCSTGVCGVEVDPVLARFASDLAWLAARDAHVERFNPLQQSNAFISNATVKRLLGEEGTGALPLIFMDGQLVQKAEYPDRAQLELWLRDNAEQVL